QRQQLAAEHLRTTAIIGQRRHRTDRVAIAEKAAEIGLKTPERGQHPGRNAELLLDALEGLGVRLDLGLAGLQAVVVRHAVGELHKTLREDALPAAILA